MLRRAAAVVAIVAGLTWAVLIVLAIRDPAGEPFGLAQLRTAALVVAFVAGSIASTGRKG